MFTFKQLSILLGAVTILTGIDDDEEFRQLKAKLRVLIRESLKGAMSSDDLTFD